MMATCAAICAPASRRRVRGRGIDVEIGGVADEIAERGVHLRDRLWIAGAEPVRILDAHGRVAPPGQNLHVVGDALLAPSDPAAAVHPDEVGSALLVPSG